MTWWLALKAFGSRYALAIGCSLVFAGCALLFCIGVNLGKQVAEGECAKGKVDVVIAAHADYVRQVAQGASAAAELHSAIAQATDYADQLKTRLAHVSVLAPRTQAAASSAAGQPQLAVAPDPVVRLGAGAVSVWNSALAGADVSAGACRADDPTAPACAASTEFTPEDAWANHATNAELCRVDRLTLQRLEDFLNQRTTNRSIP